MRDKDSLKNPLSGIGNPKNILFPGYPLYPADEDIYLAGHKEANLDPEDLTKTKTQNEIPETRNESDFKNHVSGDDLDIPGSELDDSMEEIGSEDEENNGYSLGGDNHNDLEEDRGE